jgi:acetyl-CoA carboxylase biotin carboxyl carrier protein
MPGQDDVAGLVALIDRLEALLERSSLAELEVEAQGTTVVLRSMAAVSPPGQGAGTASAPGAEPPLPPPTGSADDGLQTVAAPLTGIFYRSPSPGAQAYVREGGPVSAGQVIGLIEAMKLFNEIKSDVSGTVRRVLATDGGLVKVREPLIEVEPA